MRNLPQKGLLSTYSMLHFNTALLIFVSVLFLNLNQLSAQTTPPLLSFSDFPSDLSFSCDDDMPIDFVYPSVALDTLGAECSGTLAINYIDNTIAGNCENSHVVERVWSAEICGEIITATQLLNFDDTTPPTILGPIDGAHLCESNVVSIFPSSQDNCQATVSLLFDSVQSQYCDGIILKTFTITATDNCGNTTVGTRAVYIHDLAPPAFTSIPVDETVSCSEAVTLQSATFDCAEGMTYIEGGNVSFPSCAGSLAQTQTYSLTDACGSNTLASRVVSVIDDIPPVLDIPEDITINCPEIPVLVSATAFDVCSNQVINVIETVDSIPTDCGLYSLIRTFTATDACGNTSSSSQTITVIDNTPPEFSFVPLNIEFDCSETMPSDVDLGVALAFDNCSDVVVSLTDVITDGQCPVMYTRERFFTAVDACGNETLASQIITVVDNTAPVITLDSESSVAECGDNTANSVPVIVDDCSTYEISTAVSYLPAGTCSGEGITTLTYTATDACGNSSTAVKTVTLTDDTSPVFDSVLDDVVVSCESDLPTDLPLHSDGCSTSTLSESTSEVLGDCPGERVVTRSFVITDPCGNANSASQIVTFVDETPPIFTVLPPDSIDIFWALGESVPTPNYAIDDNCDSNASVSMTETSSVDNSEGSGFAETIIRTYTATDGCLNSTTVTSIIIYHPQVIGCTDSLACNYDSVANDDDGSCIYLDSFNICGGDNTLQGAIDATISASLSDTLAPGSPHILSVPDGTYPSVSISSAITVIASTGAVIDASGSPYAIAISGSSVTIDGFTLLGDDATVIGISLLMGSNNAAIRNCDISGMGATNPVNSPLSYGIRFFNDDIGAATTGAVIEDNVIHDLAGVGVSLSIGGADGTTITNNSFSNITPLIFNGELVSVGVQAISVDGVTISNNSFNTIVGATSVLLSTSAVVSGNSYSNITALHIETTTDNADFTTTAYWALAEVDIPGNTNVLKVYFANLDGDIASPGAFTFANTGTTVVDSDGVEYVEDCHDVWGGSGVLTFCGCDIFDEDEDGVCPADEVLGCTDPAACNFEPISTEEDGSCVYADSFGICYGDNTLQGAIDATISASLADLDNPGAPIELSVPAGTYSPVSISGAISLIALPGAIIDAAGSTNAIEISGASVTIDGLTIQGDGSTVIGISMLTGSNGAIVRNCDISGMGASNPTNSPLSYGIRCANDGLGVPTTGVVIENNVIHDLAGVGVLISSGAADGAMINNNTFSNITPLIYEGELVSLGVQAAYVNGISISDNSFTTIVGATSVLLSTSAIVSGNTYTDVPALHIETTTDNADFTTSAYWALAEVNIPGNSNVLKVYFANLDGDIAYPGAFTFANTGTTVIDSDGVEYVEDCHGVWGGGGVLTFCGCDIFDEDEDGVCPADEVLGCTDPAACNFDLNATEEDGSCIDDPIGYDCQGNSVPEEFCGPGTEWDELQGICIAITLEMNCYLDTDGDGVVGSGDLLNMLSVYGAFCE